MLCVRPPQPEMPNAADHADAPSSFGLVSDVSNLGFRHVQACADHIFRHGCIASIHVGSETCMGQCFLWHLRAPTAGDGNPLAESAAPSPPAASPPDTASPADTASGHACLGLGVHVGHMHVEGLR